MNASLSPPDETNLLPGENADFELPVKSKLRKTFLAAVLLAFSLFAAALIIPISGAVIAVGEIAPASEVKRIAHPAGGVIEAIAVQDGDHVEEGSVLLRLDTSVSEISAELTERSVDQMLAQRARLRAEIENRTSIQFPSELLRRSDASAREALAAEQRQFRLNTNERASIYKQLSERISQLDRQIDSYNSQISALELQRELIQPELEGVRKLWNQGYVTIRRMNELERTAVELDGAIGALQANIAGTQAQIAEAREQRVQVSQTARARAGEELARLDTMLNEQRIQSAGAADRYARSVIRAPYSGIVDQMAYNAVGDVVRPAEPILRIVPDDHSFVLEGSVRPNDIDRVRLGQAARVRISALNANTTPELQGTVNFVSAESSRDEITGLEYYRVRIGFSQEDAQLAEQLNLVPGMPAEAFIQTGSRSIISYAIKPLRDQFARAFRD